MATIKTTQQQIRGSGGGAGVAACGGGSISRSSGSSGSGSASIFGEKTPILCVTEKKTKKKQSPYWYGDPRIGLGRDLPIFQTGESP